MTPALDPRACAWLRRVARSAHRDALVLRGSIVTRHHAPVRVAVDVDHLWLGGDVEDRERALADARAIALAVLAVPDAHPLGTPTFETIWAETPFPGLRIGVDGLQIDLGWGDPLARPPIALEVEGASLSAVVPEVLYGWKVHGLFEFGHGQWRPKDLFDLWLLDRSVKLDPAALVDATRVAFTSRGTSFALCERFRTSAEWGRSRGSARRWAWFARKAPSTAPLPPYTEVVAAVRARLVPLLDRVAPIGPPSPP